MIQTRNLADAGSITAVRFRSRPGDSSVEDETKRCAGRPRQGHLLGISPGRQMEQAAVKKCCIFQREGSLGK
ncbi:hypothetical protein RRG08_003902 [Elysia crispata]|uniref:Uncharacterized protein n=1 Tax=Elysia crispata TaxID=231223 RepID=A0AAE0YT31_9GAST|nr:hypothetical protein RRG08_003902 [Elysia crispata]